MLEIYRGEVGSRVTTVHPVDEFELTVNVSGFEGERNSCAGARQFKGVKELLVVIILFEITVMIMAVVA